MVTPWRKAPDRSFQCAPSHPGSKASISAHPWVFQTLVKALTAEDKALASPGYQWPLVMASAPTHWKAWGSGDAELRCPAPTPYKSLMSPGPSSSSICKVGMPTSQSCCKAQEVNTKRSVYNHAWHPARAQSRVATGVTPGGVKLITVPTTHHDPRASHTHTQRQTLWLCFPQASCGLAAYYYGQCLYA